MPTLLHITVNSKHCLRTSYSLCNTTCNHPNALQNVLAQVQYFDCRDFSNLSRVLHHINIKLVVQQHDLPLT